MLSIITIVVGYLLGSISFSYLFGKWFKGIDIRKHGSGNAGATNTLRVLGKGPAILVLLLDALKGVVAVLLGVWAAPGPDDIWIRVLCGLAAIVGHNWPVFFGFRGGKGIATTIGVMATLCFHSYVDRWLNSHRHHSYHTICIARLPYSYSTLTFSNLGDGPAFTCFVDKYLAMCICFFTSSNEHCEAYSRKRKQAGPEKSLTKVF